MNLTRKTWTCISVLIVAAALFLIMAEASFAASNGVVGFGDVKPYSSEITLTIGQEAEIHLDKSDDTAWRGFVKEPEESLGRIIEIKKSSIEGVNKYFVKAKKAGVETITGSYNGYNGEIAFELNVRVINAESPVGFGESAPYDTEITIKEGEEAKINFNTSDIAYITGVSSTDTSVADVIGKLVDGVTYSYSINAQKEGTASITGGYYTKPAETSPIQQFQLTVNVVKMSNYKLTYVDKNEDLDADIIKDTFLNYFDDKGYYYENGQAVSVEKGTDGWLVNITVGHKLTYKDILGENGILSGIYTGNITRPTNLIGFGTKSAVTEYKTKEAFEAEQNNETEITDGAKFYPLMSVRLSSADIIVKAPLCGEKVTYDVNDYPTGAQPQAEVPKDAFYSIYKTWNGNDATYWLAFKDEDGAPKLDVLPADTVLKGDTEYIAYLVVRPYFGCYFDDFTKITINGSAILNKTIDDLEGDLEVYGTVTAEHDWDSGKVTTKPTLTKTGVKTFTCKACGEKKTSTIAKLKVNTLSAKGKTVKIKLAKLKKKTRTIDRKKAISVAKAVGTVTYKKTKGNNKITVNKKTGKITVKKGLKKGKYTVKVTVYAKGNATYGAAAKKVKVTIKVVK